MFGIATRYVWHGSRFECQWGQEILPFPHPSRPALAPPSLLSNGYLGSFPATKRQRSGGDHRPPFSTEVENEYLQYLSVPAEYCTDSLLILHYSKYIHHLSLEICAQVKVKVEFFPLHTMKVYRSRRTVPVFLNLHTRQKYAINFKPRPLYPGKSTNYTH